MSRPFTTDALFMCAVRPKDDNAPDTDEDAAAAREAAFGALMPAGSVVAGPLVSHQRPQP